MTLTIKDIQEHTIEALQKELKQLKQSVEKKDQELQEVRSLMFIMLELLGGELTIVQSEHKELIKEMFDGRIGLDVQVIDDGEIITLSKVSLL